MQEIPKVLEPLFNKALKNWDYALIYCTGHGMTAVEPTTKYEVKDGILEIEAKEVENPFYGGHPEEPKRVNLRIYLDVDFITSVDLMNFPKITPVKSKIVKP